MVPCNIDMFHPQVGVATLELLEKLRVEADYPFDQTCCGQPMANSGASAQAKATEELFVRNFADYEYIVRPRVVACTTSATSSLRPTTASARLPSSRCRSIAMIG
jgi:L-lactate dehydrogenase complex protein LldE